MNELFSSISSFVITGALLVSALLLLVVSARQVSLRGAVLLRRAKKKAQDIIADASKQANAILAETQEKHTQELLQQQNKVAELASQQMKQFQEQAQLMQTNIDVQMAELQKALGSTSTAMKERLEKALKEYDQHAKEDRETVGRRWGEKIEEVLSPLRLELQEQLTNDLSEARAAIEVYKQQQRALLEEQAVNVLEQTLQSVLGEKLSLSDHTTLVKEALKNAKTDDFFE